LQCGIKISVAKESSASAENKLDRIPHCTITKTRSIYTQQQIGSLLIIWHIYIGYSFIEQNLNTNVKYAPQILLKVSFSDIENRKLSE